MPPWPRAILLDLYGTLVEDDDVVLVAMCREVAQSTAVTPEEVAAAWDRGFHALCRESYGARFLLQKEIEHRSLLAALDACGCTADAEAMSRRLYQRWRQPPIFPEVPAVLARCDVPVCLVSNADNEEVAAVLAHHGFTFPHVVSSEDCRCYKPRPEPFLRALALLGLEPHEVLHVGDSLGNDVRGAQALGIPVLWLNRTGRPLPAEMPPPDYIAPELNGLPAILDEARSR